MIKLVACDLDGTLFNSEMAVSAANAKAVKNAQSSGIEFLIATGRAPRESRSVLKDADLHTGFINLNGALVFDENEQLMIKHSIPKAKAQQLVHLLHRAGFYFEILTANQVYSENLDQRISNVAHLMVDLNPLLDFRQAVAISAGNKTIMNMKQIHSFDNLLQDPKIEVMKIIAFDSRGHEAFTDIKKEIAAIGDNLNDESMIRAAGTGVAMGNAIPAIKKIAQVVTKRNNEDGVAYILNKFIADNNNI
ncbi:MAG: HAD-IIB family hydrolase [Lactobacillus crispatus]|jgi:HAD superfamily hydrolase (TIGR01484 family)|nr:HAD-IIB family hydrolase [Lactobacillus crispatus]MCI1335293.1 HAD-IIB family hydrolase [Lactobacillus crispatus]MCI1364953.1 HAD-IIB family hydrolase [Lactobacillus crispatus]MCI1493534.1 HAD-IIB family hydrolase [Lactobacillus crispatus]MCI1525184.1 HAD-IIB family hydrolase [Lactobacillus crispatus]